jgi:ribosomal protein S18 acetylase RimI-like enzyme
MMVIISDWVLGGVICLRLWSIWMIFWRMREWMILNNKLRRLTISDVGATLEMFDTVNWVRTHKSIERLVEWMGKAAFCIATADNKILATGGAIVQGDKVAWINMMVTHADYQRQGFGTQILNAILDYLRSEGVECIGLDALDAGFSIYEKAGFCEQSAIEMWVNDAVVANPMNNVRRFQDADLPGIVRLDAEFFGIERPQVISGFLQSYSDRCWVDEECGEISGVLLCKPRPPDGVVKIGPWLHRTAQGAEKLLCAALNDPGAPVVRVYIPDANVIGKEIIARHGFGCRLLLKRMVHESGELFPEMAKQYSIASSMTG